jgi:hypothetical protein
MVEPADSGGGVGCGNVCSIIYKIKTSVAITIPGVSCKQIMAGVVHRINGEQTKQNKLRGP